MIGYAARSPLTRAGVGLFPALLRLVLIAAVFHLLCLVFPPIALGAASAATISLLLCLLKRADHALTTITLLMSLLFIEIGLRTLNVESLSPFYRFHELLARENARYLPNQDLTLVERHGDLLAMAPEILGGLSEPKTVHVTIDQLGFRNSRSFAGQKLFVVGDSFVVGNGMSQEEVMTEQLRTAFRVDAYNLGFPSEPIHYARRIVWARKRLSGEGCFVVVMFEGNDFGPVVDDGKETDGDPTTINVLKDWAKAYLLTLRRQTRIAAASLGLGYRAWARIFRSSEGGPSDPGAAVMLRNLPNGKPMAFLRSYVANTLSMPPIDLVDRLAEEFAHARPDVFVFVPTKFRVYRNHVGETGEIPHGNWRAAEALAERLGADRIDLTDELRAAAAKGLESGWLVYFAGDTHWNGHGASIAAAAIANWTKSTDRKHCRVEG